MPTHAIRVFCLVLLIAASVSTSSPADSVWIPGPQIAGMTGAACAGMTSPIAEPGPPQQGYSERPTWTKPLGASASASAPFPPPIDTIQFFKDKNFDGGKGGRDMLQVSEVTGKPPWKEQALRGRSENKFTSLRAEEVLTTEITEITERDFGLAEEGSTTEITEITERDFGFWFVTPGRATKACGGVPGGSRARRSHAFCSGLVLSSNPSPCSP